MKYALIFLMALVLGDFGFAQQPLKEQFEQQIAASCASVPALQKHITSVEANQDEMETFVLNCGSDMATKKSSGQSIKFAFDREFVYVVEYVHSDPVLSEYFDVSRKENEVTATRKTDNEDDTPLKMQRIVYNANGSIKEIESHILKDDWFYDLEVETKVVFDEQGKYLSHTTKTINDVMISGKTTTFINARKVAR